MAADQAKVTCPTCGKGYRWREDFGGRKVKCKDCEAVFRMPDSGSESPELLRAGAIPTEDDGTIAMDDVGHDRPAEGHGGGNACPSCGNTVKETAVICVQCGFNLKTGSKVKTDVAAGGDTPPTGGPDVTGSLGSPIAAALDEREDDSGKKALMNDVIIPLGLIFFGAIGLIVSKILVKDNQITGIFSAAMVMLGMMVFLLPFMFAGILISAKIADISFGALHIAILKMAAVGMFAVAIGGVFEFLARLVDDTGFVAAMFKWGVEIAAVWGLLAWLFALDMFESAVTVTIVVVMQNVAMILTLAILGALILN